MFCKFCGTQLPDDSVFCENCGSQLRAPSQQVVQQPVQPMQPVQGYAQPVQGFAQPVQPVQGYVQQPVQGYVQQPVQGYVQQPVQQQMVYTSMPVQSPNLVETRSAYASGRVLKSNIKMARYQGEPKVGMYDSAGLLTVCDDRFEYKKNWGGAHANAFGAVGMMLAADKAKKDAADIYYFRDISKVRTGKYGGMVTTVVLEFRNGSKLTFAPNGSGGKKLCQEICDLVAPYI